MELFDRRSHDHPQRVAEQGEHGREHDGAGRDRSCGQLVEVDLGALPARAWTAQLHNTTALVDALERGFAEESHGLS